MTSSRSRDLIAAILIILGVAAVASGAGMIYLPAGIIVGGGMLVVLGIALGFGEVVEEEEEPASSTTPGRDDATATHLQLVPPAGTAAGTTSNVSDATAKSTPTNPLPPPPIPTTTTIPASNYLGVRGVLEEPSGPTEPIDDVARTEQLEEGLEKMGAVLGAIMNAPTQTPQTPQTTRDTVAGGS
jgi:hypothetical protein